MAALPSELALLSSGHKTESVPSLPLTHAAPSESGDSRMESPFSYTEWRPTRPQRNIADDLSPQTLTALIQDLSTTTYALHTNPYDPNFWFQRAQILSQLHYPELATGSAHKSSLLCDAIIRSLDQHPRRRLGYRMGFYMLDDHEYDEIGQGEAREALRDVATSLRQYAEALIQSELEFAPEFEDGMFVARPYPWLSRFVNRSDEALEQVNAELGDLCEVRRNAFGQIGKGGGSEVWGVFAKKDIKQDELVVVDRSRTWGCNGPGIDGSRDNLHGGFGCMEDLHPNADEDDIDHDMRWIRDRTGVKAASVILHCKLLLCSIVDKSSHPLVHPLLARLTPTYREKSSSFKLKEDIIIPNEALRRFGVDVFANFAYDTDVYFTILARIDNNSWSDPNVSSLNGLFAMFNHSCEPNCTWHTADDHAKMEVWTNRDVSKGEQLFVEYDCYVSGQSVAARRKRLRRWLDGDCQCGRCVREAEEVDGKAEVKVDMAWDSAVKPVLPEDEVLDRFKTTSSKGD
ncbi:unnamed protein product [Zymoseptoria tritici ST99CH_3D1]|nr:unnamed protein product [Zymoseptoria tritici ST99CH_3D1]